MDYRRVSDRLLLATLKGDAGNLIYEAQLKLVTESSQEVVQ